MKIGYACTPLLLHYKTTRKILLKYYSEELLITLIKENLDDLLNILNYNSLNNINLFRISSDIIPLASHKINTFSWYNYFDKELRNIGDYIKNNSLRVSMHPGQYTVINSPKKDVVEKSILDLKYHADFLDSLNLDRSHKIILHIGGIYGDKKSAIERFIKTYNNLDDNIKNRLVIENDEKNFSMDDLLYISQLCSIPVIFDNLHNSCFNDNKYSLYDIFKKVSNTWSTLDGNMKVHYSQQHPFKKKDAHSSTLNIDKFLEYFNICKDFNPDIMLEVKDKNISAIKVLNSISELSNTPSISSLNSEFDKYKFILLEQGDTTFNKASSIINNDKSFIKFYKFIDEIIYSETTLQNKKQVLKEIEKKIRDDIENREFKYFNKLLQEEDYIKCKNYLYKLILKYNNPLSKSYYFINY